MRSSTNKKYKIMRVPFPELVEQRRFTGDKHGTALGARSGLFAIPFAEPRSVLQIIAGDPARQSGWEHVSVVASSKKDGTLRERTPTWDEMCYVKSLFWNDDECVAQFHPPKSEYVNHHPHCLHLWRPTQSELPLPPSHLVGSKS